ncbi:unnamed protein product [Peniophora sp. CBMAI 1063]|nr:unnamed protein product [Peniophora sp. CBMAI 1063]
MQNTPPPQLSRTPGRRWSPLKVGAGLAAAVGTGALVHLHQPCYISATYHSRSSNPPLPPAPRPSILSLTTVERPAAPARSCLKVPCERASHVAKWLNTRCLTWSGAMSTERRSQAYRWRADVKERGEGEAQAVRKLERPRRRSESRI